MSLKLYFHPLSSFCQKVLIALYENDTPFERQIVNLMDPKEAAEFKAMWPIGKFPVLRDETTNRMIPESTIIIEYLERHYPGKYPLIPEDPDRARRTRMADRFYDLYVHLPMQKVVGDRLRPAQQRDPLGVDQAKAQMAVAYGMIDENTADKIWAIGEEFSMADCAAAPALYYANLAVPFAKYKNVAVYFERLMQRPSFARAVKEADPYRHMFPKAAD